MIVSVRGDAAQISSTLMSPPAAARELEKRLKDMDKRVEFFIYPGAGHAFANEQNSASYNEDAARQAWVRTLEFLRAHLG